jgi:hypothetical protein
MQGPFSVTVYRLDIEAANKSRDGADNSSRRRLCFRHLGQIQFPDIWFQPGLEVLNCVVEGKDLCRPVSPSLSLGVAWPGTGFSGRYHSATPRIRPSRQGGTHAPGDGSLISQVIVVPVLQHSSSSASAPGRQMPASWAVAWLHNGKEGRVHSNDTNMPCR